MTALAVLSCAFGYGWREFQLHHLVVRPGSNTARLVSTNVAEFADQTGTNRVGVSTNWANTGASAVGPRLFATLGGTNYLAVTNVYLFGTNHFLNGILVTP